jgi:hypothetical protein
MVIPYKKAAKIPPATAAKLMPKTAPTALETAAGLEPVAVLMPLVVLADPLEVMDPDGDVEVPLPAMVELATAGFMVAL